MLLQAAFRGAWSLNATMHFPPSPKGNKSDLLKVFLKKHEQVHLCQVSG